MDAEKWKRIVKTSTKSLRTESVGKMQHLAFNLLDFLYFWNSENGSAVVFGNPKVLMPFMAVPYMLVLEAYNFGGKRYFVKVGTEIAALFVLKVKRNVLVLHSLAVSPRFRRLGIGSFILSKAERLCKQSRLKWLELTVLKSNVPAQRLYAKLGFVTVLEGKWSLTLRKRILV